MIAETNDINDSNFFSLTKEQLNILDEEHLLYISGKTVSYTWEEAKDIIRGITDFKDKIKRK
jgi:hypothetical protein